MKEIYCNETVKIHHDPEVPCIVYTIGRLPTSSEKIRESARNLVRACQQFPVSGVLIDARGSLGVLYEDVEWSSLYITPRIIQAGVKKVAIVREDNETLNISIQEHMELSKNAPLVQEIFYSEKDARIWLKKELF